MNKQQFLVELSQYLTFFSPEEKTRIIAAYNEKFDSAGPEREAELLALLGTPMMAAIDMKRRMESGEKITFGEETPCENNQDEALSEYSVETETEETLNNENTEASDEPNEDVTNEEPLSEPEQTSPPESSKTKGAKFVFAVIGSSLISLLIAAFFLVIASIGAGLLVSTCYLFIAGLKNLIYLTDALLLFGGGLVCAGLGLIIIWFAVWSAISLISKLFRNACGAGIPDSDKE